MERHTRISDGIVLTVEKIMWFLIIVFIGALRWTKNYVLLPHFTDGFFYTPFVILY